MVDILLEIIQNCPPESLVPPQPSNDGVTALQAAASKKHSKVLGKLLKSKLFPDKEVTEACTTYGFDDLLEMYFPGPLHELTKFYPIFVESAIDQSTVCRG